MKRIYLTEKKPSRFARTKKILFDRGYPDSPFRQPPPRVQKTVWGIFLLMILIALIGFLSNMYDLAQRNATNAVKIAGWTIDTTEAKDPRVRKVKEFLKAKGSPMVEHADEFVSLADAYGLDYTLMPAISCKESSCGKHLANTFNPFGMTTGKKTGPRFRAFGSWTEAIEAEAKLLSNNYRWNANRGIQQKYCPDVECHANWTDHVTGFSKEILEK